MSYRKLFSGRYVFENTGLFLPKDEERCAMALLNYDPSSAISTVVNKDGQVSYNLWYDGAHYHGKTICEALCFSERSLETWSKSE